MAKRLERAKATWTPSALSIRASSRDDGCINRPDTRQHLILRAQISPTPPLNPMERSHMVVRRLGGNFGSGWFLLVRFGTTAASDQT
ncbi:MAG: hypothetical protein K2X54_27120 [Methylobacterium organophilum]|jgi:hypothetical protein|nr:hypothetical protein [Methylobacterium organophilum]